jgi:hypothetical protein
MHGAVRNTGSAIRASLLVVVSVIAIVPGACTSGRPPLLPTTPHLTTPTTSPNPASTPIASASALGQQGLDLPATYQEACAQESVCLPGTTGRIPAALDRPLHLPTVARGERCPTTTGHHDHTPLFDGIALGTGLVRPLIAMGGDPRHGTTVAAPTQYPGWIAFKTLWFSVPRYQGPFVIRGKRLDRTWLLEFGGSPTPGPLVIPPGPTINSRAGYRTAPGGTWVNQPGCYGWQVDGLDFSDVIVVRVVSLPGRSP